MEQIQPGISVKVITSRGVLTAPQVVITAGEPACVYVLMHTVCRVYYKVVLIGIMVCAGPWCPKLVEPLGLKLPLKACEMWTHKA